MGLEGDMALSDRFDYEYFRDTPLKELMDKALEFKLKNRGCEMGLCTITNAKSGKCSEDCAFCAQSARYHTDAPVYPLKSLDEVLKEAEDAKRSGAKRFSIVISGKGPDRPLLERIANYISAIKRETGISTCASLGVMDKECARILKEAGLKRYHHNLETSSRFFPKICTTHTYEERIQTIKSALEVGLEVCAGGIIGLGESEKDRYLMARDLAQLGVQSCPLNILVPIKGTPLEKRPVLSMTEILRTVSMWRIMLPWAAIRLAGGREKVLKDMQALAFMAGADAMLIGGYLTTRGRFVEEDMEMTAHIKEIWKAAQPF